MIRLHQQKLSIRCQGLQFSKINLKRQGSFLPEARWHELLQNNFLPNLMRKNAIRESVTFPSDLRPGQRYNQSVTFSQPAMKFSLAIILLIAALVCLMCLMAQVCYINILTLLGRIIIHSPGPWHGFWWCRWLPGSWRR